MRRLVCLALAAALACLGLVPGCGAVRRCKNPDCTEAISIVRAFRDYESPHADGFRFKSLNTFSVHSKDSGMWEGKVSQGPGPDGARAACVPSPPAG